MSTQRLKPGKDPSAVLDYKFDWAPLTNESDGGKSDWLASGETISSFTIAIAAHADTPEDAPTLTEDSSSKTDTNTSVTVWLSSGTDEIDYVVSCTIVTSAGRTDKRSIIIPVESR